MNNLRNPYFKEYKKAPLVPKPHYTFKLPEEVKTDFDEYLKAFPNPNKAMLELVIEILNSRCTERKYYDIDVVSICPYDFEEGKENIGCFIAGTDYYLLRSDSSIDIPSSIILNKELYLNPSKVLDLEDFSFMLNNNQFSDSEIEPIDFIYLNQELQEYSYLHDLNFSYGYSLVYFKINNFLDEFVDNEYKSENGNHKGIGYYISDYDVPYFYVYDWKFNEDFSFELLNIKLIDETDFKSLILDSSNDELKQFLKDFKDLSSYSSVSSYNDGIEGLKDRIDELEKELSEVNILNDMLQKENERIKLDNVQLHQENKRTEKVEELYQLVRKIKDKNEK